MKNYLAYRFAAYPASTGFSNLRKDSETPLWLLLGISGMVLLIACANLANLMLVRASARERQIAIRLALGATRVQLIVQQLSECLILAIAGAIFGILLATAVSHALVVFVSTQNSPIVLDLDHGLAGAGVHGRFGDFYDHTLWIDSSVAFDGH